MRNFKKVLSLVLCMAMMLSVMVVGAGAAFNDQSKINNAEAVDACAALNIINGYTDGSFRPEGTITRAEACKMICVALNGGKDPVLGTSAAASFTDTKGHWAEGYIESCVAQGIVAGVGGGKFNPNGNVTGTQFAKMLLIALGYNSDNEGYVGAAWEVEVNVDASAKGLYADLSGMDPSKALSRDNAAQMVWNALNAYEVEYKYNLVSENGQLVSKLVLQDKVVGSNNDKITLLEDKYEAKTFTGTFNGNADVCKLDDGEIQVYGSVNDGDKVTANFKYDFDLKYIGEEVNVLFKDATGGTKNKPDNKDTIYGIYVTGETKVYNITKNDLQTQKEAGTVRFGDKNYDVVGAAKDFEYINKNYGAIKTTASSAMTADEVADAITALKATSADTIKLVCDNNGKIVKAYVVESNLARVTAVNSEKVSLNNGVGAIKIADNDVYSGIAKDDIVVATTLYKDSATASGAYTTVEKVDTVEGKLTGYNGTAKVTIDGTVYKIVDANDDGTGELATTAIDSDFVTSFADQIGETYKLYLIGGIVYAAEQLSDGTKNYAVVEDATGSDGSTFDPLKAKIMKADGSEVTVEIHKDSIADAKNRNNYLKTGAIIKYSDVSDGKIKITEISAPISNTITAADTATTNTVYNKDTKSFVTTAASTASGTPVVTASDAVVFVQKGSDWYTYTVRNLDNITVTGNVTPGTDVTYKTNSMTSDSKVVAAYVTLATKPSGASSTTVYGIVSAENGTVKVGNDTYTSWTVDLDVNTQKTVLIEGAGDTTLVKGDLVSFDVSADDVYSASDITLFARYASSTLSTSNNAVAGYVKEYDEAGQIMSFYANISGPSDGIYTGTDMTTKAVDDDVKIIYVSSEDDKAASEVGVNAFDAVAGKKNVVVAYKDNNTTKPIVAIFVDVDNNMEQ